MHRLAGVFYVTNMSNLTYLFTDLPYFFRKNTDRFYCDMYIKTEKEVKSVKVLRVTQRSN